jgi:hypothetical protein
MDDIVTSSETSEREKISAASIATPTQMEEMSEPKEVPQKKEESKKEESKKEEDPLNLATKKEISDIKNNIMNYLKPKVADGVYVSDKIPNYIEDEFKKYTKNFIDEVFEKFKKKSIPIKSKISDIITMLGEIINVVKNQPSSTQTGKG